MRPARETSRSPGPRRCRTPKRSSRGSPSTLPAYAPGALVPCPCGPASYVLGITDGNLVPSARRSGARGRRRRRRVTCKSPGGRTSPPGADSLCCYTGLRVKATPVTKRGRRQPVVAAKGLRELGRLAIPDAPGDLAHGQPARGEQVGRAIHPNGGEVLAEG